MSEVYILDIGWENLYAAGVFSTLEAAQAAAGIPVKGWGHKIKKYGYDDDHPDEFHDDVWEALVDLDLEPTRIVRYELDRYERR